MKYQKLNKKDNVLGKPEIPSNLQYKPRFIRQYNYWSLTLHQLHLHSRLIMWLQCIQHWQLQEETRNL